MFVEISFPPPCHDEESTRDISTLTGVVVNGVKYNLISNLPLVEQSYQFPEHEFQEKKNSSGITK